MGCHPSNNIRESVTNAVPPHLRRDVSSVIQAVWPPRVAVLFQFGRALLRNQRASPGSRSSGNPTDVRPRVAGLVVSQALWICSLQVGRPRSTADLQLDEHFPPPVQLNSILRIVGMVVQVSGQILRNRSNPLKARGTAQNRIFAFPTCCLPGTVVPYCPTCPSVPAPCREESRAP